MERIRTPVWCKGLMGDQSSSLLTIYSHISFWCNHSGSAFLRMNSSASIPSIVGGRFTRFCFPCIKMVISSFRRRFFSAFSDAVNLRFLFGMMETALYLLLANYRRKSHFSIVRQNLIPGAPFWHSGHFLSLHITGMLPRALPQEFGVYFKAVVGNFKGMRLSLKVIFARLISRASIGEWEDGPIHGKNAQLVTLVGRASRFRFGGMCQVSLGWIIMIGPFLQRRNQLDFPG